MESLYVLSYIYIYLLLNNPELWIVLIYYGKVNASLTVILSIAVRMRFLQRGS